MRKLLETHIGGIKCDAPGCGWHEDSVEWDDMHVEIAAWLNKPCPKCGANLLTEADANTVVTWYKFSSIVNKYFGWLPQIPPIVLVFIVGLFIGANFGSNGMVLFTVLVFGVYYKMNPPEEEKGYTHSIEMDGSGKMKFKKK